MTDTLDTHRVRPWPKRSRQPRTRDNRITYTFTVVVELDDDAWHAYCPALQGYGAATWGSSHEEALRHIGEVVGMVVAELVEDREELPADVDVSEGTRVSVMA